VCVRMRFKVGVPLTSSPLKSTRCSTAVSAANAPGAGADADSEPGGGSEGSPFGALAARVGEGTLMSAELIPSELASSMKDKLDLTNTSDPSLRRAR
jgi:hypothetical protein